MYGFTYDVPIDPDTYAQIRRGLGGEPPTGLVAHVVYRTDGGLRYVDVWESRADWERFVEERLHPVVDRVLTERLGFRPPEPPMSELDVVDAWVQGG
ncbi:MAG: hypothetical protein ACJ769_04430 [Chloroflexota bacterium]